MRTEEGDFEPGEYVWLELSSKYIRAQRAPWIQSALRERDSHEVRAVVVRVSPKRVTVRILNAPHFWRARAVGRGKLNKGRRHAS